MEDLRLLGVVALICLGIATMASSAELKVELRRRAEGSLNTTEGIRSAVDRSKTRLNAIRASVNQRLSGQLDAQAPVKVGNGEFLLSLSLGTPPVSIDMIVDTGSDLIWTECSPCQTCQSKALFDPSKSSSYSALSCNDSRCSGLGTFQTGCQPDCLFGYTYADGSETTGDLSADSLALGRGPKGKFSSIAFGCAHEVTGRGFTEDVGGLVGLGRGPLSLISQLGPKVGNKFSYCLVPVSSSKTSPLILGGSASFAKAQTISLLKNSQNPSFWYVPLQGISVNGKAVRIPAGSFDLQSDGSGGVIIDSGTTLTLLSDLVYSPVMVAIETAIHMKRAQGSSSGLDLCYKTDNTSAFPRVTFNFKGGASYELPPENLAIKDDSGFICVALAPSGGGAMSIIGNIQQQNFHILYDNAKNTLSFAPAKCDSL